MVTKQELEELRKQLKEKEEKEKLEKEAKEIKDKLNENTVRSKIINQAKKDGKALGKGLKKLIFGH